MILTPQDGEGCLGSYESASTTARVVRRSRGRLLTCFRISPDTRHTVRESRAGNADIPSKASLVVPVSNTTTMTATGHLDTFATTRKEAEIDGHRIAGSFYPFQSSNNIFACQYALIPNGILAGGLFFRSNSSSHVCTASTQTVHCAPEP